MRWIIKLPLKVLSQLWATVIVCSRFPTEPILRLSFMKQHTHLTTVSHPRNFLILSKEVFLGHAALFNQREVEGKYPTVLSTQQLVDCGIDRPKISWILNTKTGRQLEVDQFSGNNWLTLINFMTQPNQVFWSYVLNSLYDTGGGWSYV